MKKYCISTLFLLVGLTAWADAPSGYYNNAVGKKNEALMTALEGIVYSHTELSYGYLWTAFDYTDLGDDGYYIDMYSNCKYDNQSDHTAGASHVGEGINREHSMPKSWFGSMTPSYTDLHMLIPTDAYVNQRRNNYPYGVCADGNTYTHGSYTMRGKLGTSTYDGYTQTVFEPDDEFKGDFARIYFYMVTCYKSSVHNWPGSDQLDYAANGYKAFSTWSMNMLLEWHRADPVSAKEIARNEGVYGQQGNRNPFVDHPELAEYIWGSKQGTAWSGDDSVDPITKDVPELYAADTTAVTHNSFRADWSREEHVSSYTLQVNKVEDSQELTLLLTENFSNMKAYKDGSSDISGLMDDYADNPGWTGYKLYEAANHGVKVGTSSTAGYLISPELALGRTVSVAFNAKSWINSKGVSDGSSVIVACGNACDTIALSENETNYAVVLENCNGKNIKFSMTAGGKRFYIYNANIYNGNLEDLTCAPRRAVVEKGDSTVRTISGITDTCYTVAALQNGTFEYKVKAVYTDGTQSVWSNTEYVTLKAGSDFLIGDINSDGEVNVGDLSTLIDYLLGGYPYGFNKSAADVNNDNEINVGDVSALIDRLLSGK